MGSNCRSGIWFIWKNGSNLNYEIGVWHGVIIGLEVVFVEWMKYTAFFLGEFEQCMCSLPRQYGLSKGTLKHCFIIEADRTLGDRGPDPAHQVLKDLEGSYGFVVYDGKAGKVFAALSADEVVKLFWGVVADGSVVVSNNLKGTCFIASKDFDEFLGIQGANRRKCQELIAKR